jgi:HAD superfamily hydrolase (TIGR01509 family)
MIKAIVFDYGGVIELKDGDLIQEIADSLRITKEDWQEVYFTFNHLNNTGQKSWREVATIVAQKFNASDIQISFIQDLINKYDQKRILNLELIEIIKDLKTRDYKIGILSNYSITLREKLTRLNIIDLFDEVIISSEVGLQKPQPEIFEILFNKLRIKNNEMIFIDDTKRSLEGANKIGYIPVLYTNNKTLKSDLADILEIKF